MKEYQKYNNFNMKLLQFILKPLFNNKNSYFLQMSLILSNN